MWHTHLKSITARTKSREAGAKFLDNLERFRTTKNKTKESWFPLIIESKDLELVQKDIDITERDITIATAQDKEASRVTKAGNARHKETRSMKADTIAQFQKTKHLYIGKNGKVNKGVAATKLAGTFVNVSYSTVKRWLTNQ
jgi:hypothetical protein